METIDIRKTFDSKFKITKDCQSLRRKGVILEEVKDGLHDLYGPFKCVNEKSDYGMYPAFEVQAVSEKDPNIGYYAYWCRYGIPTFVIGCDTKKNWEAIRNNLIDKGYLRELKNK